MYLCVSPTILHLYLNMAHVHLLPPRLLKSNYYTKIRRDKRCYACTFSYSFSHSLISHDDYTLIPIHLVQFIRVYALLCRVMWESVIRNIRTYASVLSIECCNSSNYRISPMVALGSPLVSINGKV